MELSEAERNLLNPDPPPIYKFVFTGGPCGGKTTALARVFYYLRERGFEVITCPEAFTIMSSNGMSTDFFSTSGIGKIIQGSVLDVQLSLEDSVERVLRARGKPSVILCDRGTMDGSVYVDKEDFASIMSERNTDIVQLRDNRYNAIFHLVTAADGAETYYTLENNKVRTETPEQARECDRRTQHAWVGSPHLYVLDNSTDFEGKMIRLVDIISKIVGLPSNLERGSAKFLLKSPPDMSKFPDDITYQVFEVEKVYLQQSNTTGTRSPDDYAFIRRRTNIDPVSGRLVGSVYGLTAVTYKGGEMIEQKRIISQREYMAAYMTRDRSRHIVRQRRISFLYAQQSFNVHIYVQPNDGLCILHAQVEAKNNDNNKNGDIDSSSDYGTSSEASAAVEVKIPPFLDVERQLHHTKDDENKYGAYSLSLINK